MAKSDLLTIPGIGRTFVKDFARIGVFSISDLIDQDPDELFESLRAANEAVDHKTSKSYLKAFWMVAC